MGILRAAQLQMQVSADQSANLETAAALMEQTCREWQPDLVTLPEMFCCPYGSRHFPAYAVR